jgi:4-hydroxythreonine-4-phosphate dehydrogenase
MRDGKKRAALRPHPPSPIPHLPIVAVTSGEPAGIGPDLCLALAGRAFRARVVVLGDRAALAARASGLDLDVRLADFDPLAIPSPGVLELVHRPAAAPVVPGRLDPANARYVLALLDAAVDGCLAGTFDAVVTAPVQKSVINDAGIPFTGHTEYLAERAGADVVMMLAGGGLRVALATTHVALADVAREITRAGLERTLRIVDAELRRRFGIARPRILVAGLNPHAGEAGYLGREEIEVIAPAVDKLAREGLAVRGPLPADTLFTPRRLREADCVLAMYHDQGLPVLKHAAFGRGVNVTLGLPFVRTSVDHGTALDLAGTGKADPTSLVEAVEMAIDMVGLSPDFSQGRPGT